MCVCVWVFVFVSVHAPFPHPAPRITLGTSTSLWWVYQIGISCHPSAMGPRTHTVNNRLRFKYPSGSDTDPRLPLQSYQHSIISSQNFINTTKTKTTIFNVPWRRLRARERWIFTIARADSQRYWKRSWSNCENEQHVIQVSGPAGVGGRDEGRLRKVKSWLRLAAGGITGQREMWSGGTRWVERRAGWVFSVMTGWRAAGSCFPAWWENSGPRTALSAGPRSLVQQRCSTGGDSQAYQVKKKCVPGHRGIFLLGQCVSDRSEVGWDQAG